MAIREPHVSIGHRHQPLKSSQLPIPLRHVAIRWRHQPINCPHRTIRFRHLSREWLHSGLKISTVTAGDSRPRFCLSTAPAAHVPGQPHISLRSFRLDAANRTLHKADEDTDLLQPSKRRRASLHRRRKRSRLKPSAQHQPDSMSVLPLSSSFTATVSERNQTTQTKWNSRPSTVRLKYSERRSTGAWRRRHRSSISRRSTVSACA